MMSANEMVTLLFSFMIPIFIMNGLSFGLGLLMEPIRFKRKRGRKTTHPVEVPSDPGRVENEHDELKKLFDEFRDDVEAYDLFVKNRELELDERERKVLENEQVYDEYKKQKGTSRQDLGDPVAYHEIAQILSEGIVKIGDQELPKEDRLLVEKNIRETLDRCVLDKNLDHLTSIYKDDKADNVLGYKPESVANFAGKMIEEYPKPLAIEENERMNEMNEPENEKNKDK